ncbi:MAG TPA: DNA topoisomerase VI subunit B [Planctomycetota bacterium]|nr:DNA topoisomerase VI subunit B [Planctomycetota bacterium]
MGALPMKKSSPGPKPESKPDPPVTKSTRVFADELAKKQREISVSEFFAKNRHLLGFDNPRKALLTAVKEAVDNSLDACEEAKILPELEVKIEVAKNGGPAPAPSQAERFIVSVTDNGPGIVPEQIPRIFAKLLYGSKFHRLRMSRGQQGIGISAAGLYGMLTTGKPVRVLSRWTEKKPARYVEIQIDTAKNEPKKLVDRDQEWDRHHGTQVSIELDGRYQKGRTSVDEFLEQVAIANPHAKIAYVNPEGLKSEFPRLMQELPPSPREIKPHPYGIELGVLLKMMQDTKSHWLSGFLSSDFSRVSPKVAQEIAAKANLKGETKPRTIVGEAAERLYKAIQQTKLMNPPTDCLSPIGEKAVLAGLYKQIRGDFYTAVTRSPAVYRGNPFVIEVGLAYGTGSAKVAPGAAEAEEAGPLAEGEEKEAEVPLARLLRFANRVPLLYQPGACAITKAVLETGWRNYGISQSRGALPQGPLVIFVHMASVWVPFTSESKEAIADYDEIRKEIRLALNEAGRRLATFVRRRDHALDELKRRDAFEAYIEEVADACKRLKRGKLNAEDLKKRLQKIAHSITGGEKTDALAKKKPDHGPAPESTIIVTEKGPEGAVPPPPAAESSVQSPESKGEEASSPKKAKPGKRGKR